MAERDSLRKHYDSIEGEIDECRRVYEEVEASIVKAERELIQLGSYLDTRAQEDRQTVSCPLFSCIN